MSWTLVIILISPFPFIGDDVKVTVKGVTSIGTIDDNFICATLDWWPEAKCYYGQCPWGKSGIMNLNLNNPILSNAIKAFKALRIRIGGSMQDQVLALVTFGINALYGRKKLTAYGLYDGHWDSMNARDFVNYTIFKGYKIDSWELGHELCGSGISARVDARQYGEDVIRLKKLLNKLYRRFKIQPKLLGPAGFYDEKWFSSFLQKSGPNVIDVVTHHIYNLGSGVNPNLIHYIRDPLFLDKVAQTYKDLETTLQRFGPWASAWVGESGGAYNSGGKTTNFSRWELRSSQHHNYGSESRYYSALLWHRLMGKSVLSTTHNGSPYLRAYSHCSKMKPGITILLINMSNSTAFNVSVESDVNLYPLAQPEGVRPREEYHLTPKGGCIQSEVMLLNGFPLVLTERLDIPPMKPFLVDGSLPIKVAPDSIVFATIRDFKAPACAWA
ncbi:hypothetical protein C5167_005841 [Papaver somniferum]|uniref:Heparanase-like protein 1 n=1 Tax=Papaver somniferum TaxID=3469 RepID=A0A4Y7JFG4_PAPSO|nr:hypothetical protein C5167_005841 [Papaver somniferum]